MSLRQHLLHDLDRRGDHNVTVASKPQSLGCGGGIVRDKLLLQKIRAPQGVKPLREPLLQLLGLSHRPLFGADHIRRVSWGQQIQHHDGAGHSAA